MTVELLVPQEKLLEAGVHIGTRNKNGGMKQYIYKARDDGLHVLDLKKMNEKLFLAAKVIARYKTEQVFVVGSKDNAKRPISKFCELTSCQPLIGRFTPGMFTNPSRKDFYEPRLVIVVDPGMDRQAVKEAYTINVPIIAFCDTNNSTRYLDLIIPCNNKGRKSLALMFWVLAREVLKLQEKIKTNEEFESEQQEFEA
ncbi:MAG: 30S ribosomal protein S2 [Candidatus Micrarchaeia archaeon]